jgi:hypothetical protein
MNFKIWTCGASHTCLSLIDYRQRICFMLVIAKSSEELGHLQRKVARSDRDAGHGPDARESFSAYRITPSKSSGVAVNETSHHASVRVGPGGDCFGGPAVLVSHGERASDSTAHALRTRTGGHGFAQRHGAIGSRPLDSQRKAHSEASLSPWMLFEVIREFLNAVHTRVWNSFLRELGQPRVIGLPCGRLYLSCDSRPIPLAGFQFVIDEIKQIAVFHLPRVAKDCRNRKHQIAICLL